MKITIVLLLFLSFISFSIHAQNLYSVKGIIVDTAVKAKLANSSISVLNAKDSVLRSFTRADASGAFTIDNLTKGKFILLVTYPGYADYVEPFTLDSAKQTRDFGRLNMLLKAKLLADVIIKGSRVPIKIKGDTTEFNAKAYVIQPNDKVEDLLRQLPGIQVDKDGVITAQGQTVSKVLVDGEEFFGDDPTLVTKNIRADMVDKVQLYDKKSDQAAFTGIDDGQKTKTINIKLKEDKKNGMFGKVNANAGTDGYYEGQLLFNKFKASQKFSAYGTLANDGKTGLGFEDSNRLGAGGDIQFVDGGVILISNNSNDALDSFNGRYDGKGIPVARSGGLHYDIKWNADKESLNTNYKIGSIEVTGLTNTINQRSLSTGLQNTNSNQTFDDYGFRQKMDAVYKLKLDTTSDLKISADATLKNFRVNNNYLSVTDADSTRLNRNSRSVINHGDQRVFNLAAFYTKKFKKVGRTISWSLSESYNNNQTNGFLNSETDYFNPTTGVQDSSKIVNQYKTTDATTSLLNSNIVYSEPLSKKTAVLFNYGFAVNNSSTDRQSFNQSAPGVYDILDNTYSNSYKFNQLTNQLGAIFNYKANKMIFNFGSKVSGVNFKQVDEISNGVLKRNFINWNPQATFQYNYSQYKSFYFNYSGNTQQPTIDQLQPVLDNADQLNIVIGNPNLKPSFSNRLYLYYNNYQVLTGQQFYFYVNYSNTMDAIVNNTTEDAVGNSTTQYFNLANKNPYNYNAYISASRKIEALADIQAGINFNASGNVSYSYINGALDQANSHTYSGQLSISKYAQKKYDFSLYGGPSYTFSTMSLQPGTNNNAAGFNSSARFNLYLPLKFGVGSDIRYSYTAKTQAFSAQYKTIWNAYINKAFTKDDKLKISLSVNDLLNQNNNFSRSVNGYNSTQTTTTSIRRFFMLSLVWDFTKFGTVPAKN